MKRISAIAVTFAFAVSAYAGSGSIGITYNRIVSDSSYGAVFEYETKLGNLPFNFTGQAQVGNVYRGKYHADLSFPLLGTSANLFVDGLIKGYALDDLGRQQDFGVSIDIPNSPIGIGIFGRNAGPFGPPNAGDDLEALGYDPAALEERDLYSLNPAPTGLTFKGGSSFNALITTDFDFNGIDANLRLLPELIGDGAKAHQAILHLQTDVQKIKVGLDLGLQAYDGELEYETAALISVAFKIGSE